MRVGFRTLASLALCAAAVAAALAHIVIDIAGDYLLTRDTYDHIEHSSRELMTGIALLIAAVLAARGLRICCDIAAANRGRLERPVLRFREVAGFLVAAVAASIVAVPAMELLDGWLDRVPVQQLDDAFGGSLLLGLVTTILCATVVATLVYTIARWLISHRDSITTIIETLLRIAADGARPSGYRLSLQRFVPRRRRATHALRLAKRGPPVLSLV